MIEPASSVGGGMVEGTGTGLLNNTKDTIGLIADGTGYLLNKATFGYSYRDEAQRTGQRVDGAVALANAVRTDPLGTAIKLGSDYIRPFAEGAQKLDGRDYYAGTAQITEAGSDLIVQAVTGGSRAILNVLRKGEKLVPDVDISPDTSGGLGGVGPYNPEQVRADLEARYGAENVSSTTLPPLGSRYPGLAGTHQDLADGTRIVFDNRGFPIFDDITRYETRIVMKAGDRPADLRAATRDLRAAISEGKVDAKQFRPDQLAAINSGKAKIPDLTWHHHQDRNRMQLVPFDAHNEVKHIGSVSLNKRR